MRVVKHYRAHEKGAAGEARITLLQRKAVALAARGEVRVLLKHRARDLPPAQRQRQRQSADTASQDGHVHVLRVSVRRDAALPDIPYQIPLPELAAKRDAPPKAGALVVTPTSRVSVLPKL